MYPSSHTFSFVQQPTAIFILLVLLMLRCVKVCIHAHRPVPLFSIECVSNIRLVIVMRNDCNCLHIHEM